MFVSLLLALVLADIGSAATELQSQIVESREVVAGPSAEVEILIDRWGVPHIYVSSSEDAFFAQGWNAARDRLWRFGVQPKMTRDAVLLESLAGALTDIEHRFGKDRSKWRWGNLSSIRFAHPLSAAVDETSRHQMSIGHEPMAGDGATVALAAYDTQEFRTQYGAAFRMVLKQAVAPMRAGRKLTPKHWPNGAKVAVLVSWDMDNESFDLASGRTEPVLLSRGEYGARAALPRIMSLHDKLDILRQQRDGDGPAL